jgi:hypothetical protein
VIGALSLLALAVLQPSSSTAMEPTVWVVSSTLQRIEPTTPPGTPARTFAGAYDVTSAQGHSGGPVRLSVLRFTVPLAPTLLSNFNASTKSPPGENDELLRDKVMPDKVPLAAEKRLIARNGLDTTDLGFSSGAYYGHCVMSAPPSVAAIKNAAASHDPRLRLYDYSADEIERCPKLFPRVKAWARNLHAAGIPNLITIAPVPALYDDGSGTGRSAVDTWTVLPFEYVAAQAKNPPRITYVLRSACLRRASCASTGFLARI